MKPPYLEKVYIKVPVGRERQWEKVCNFHSLHTSFLSLLVATVGNRKLEINLWSDLAS